MELNTNKSIHVSHLTVRNKHTSYIIRDELTVFFYNNILWNLENHIRWFNHKQHEHKYEKENSPGCGWQTDQATIV